LNRSVIKQAQRDLPQAYPGFYRPGSSEGEKEMIACLSPRRWSSGGKKSCARGERL